MYLLSLGGFSFSKEGQHSEMLLNLSYLLLRKHKDQFFSAANSTMPHSYETINSGQQNDGYEQPVNNRNNIQDQYDDVEGTMRTEGNRSEGVSKSYTVEAFLKLNIWLTVCDVLSHLKMEFYCLKFKIINLWRLNSFSNMNYGIKYVLKLIPDIKVNF